MPASRWLRDPLQGWQASRGISGSFRLDSVAALPWNQWQLSCGTGGRFAVESVAGLAWNTHPERGLAMVYGPRGIGKTQFMLGLATHLATGQPYLGWKIPKPVGVLYIDGEMPLDELRQRAVLLAEQQCPTSLYFLSGEMVYTRLERDLVLTQEPI